MSKPFFQPVKPFYIGQKFGENKACVPLTGGNKLISCDGNNPPPGYKSVYGPKGHTGVDLYAPHNTPVYCACAGVVSQIDTHERTGLDVRVVSEIDGKKYRHIYEHLLGYQPKVGDKVEIGSLIGWADNTGYSAGDHLHFQIEEEVDNQWVPIDPLPLLEQAYALEVGTLVGRVKELIARLSDLVADKLRK